MTSSISKGAFGVRVVPTVSLKPGDPVCDYYPTEADALDEIESHVLPQPEPATAEDIADAGEWPWAVVPEED